MDSQIQLTKEEAAALDLLIQAYGDGGPGGFIVNVVNATRKVVRVVQQATPVLQVATAFVGGPGSGPDQIRQQVRDSVGTLPGGLTVEQLIEARRNAIVTDK